MKKFIFIALMSLTLSGAMAQNVPYNVVFDVTSPDTVVHQMVIRWINEILSTDPLANIEVVFYAKSLDMITKDKSVVAKDVIKYAATQSVTFSVCEVAMMRNNVQPGQLLTGVQTVPDGIYELVKKQHAGWGYIKAAR